MDATQLSEPNFWGEVLANTIQVIVIVVVAVLLRLILAFVIKRVVERVVSGVKRKQAVDDTQALSASPVAAVRTVQRARTLGDVLGNIVTVAISIFATLSVLFTIAPQVSGAFSLITAALGAGLGFGAQNIVKDVLNGLFMVVEDQLGVGDIVDTGQATGVVESVGIRITQIRDVNGTLWYVRNGEIVRVGNMSQGWARVIIDLAVPYDADIDAVQERMLATANELATTPKWRSMVMERPELWGLESISTDALVVRIVMKTRTSARDDVARELRLRLKRTLDAMGVKLPSLHTVVLTGMEGATSVRGARPPKTAPVPTKAEPAPAAKKPRLPRIRKPKTEHPGAISLPPTEVVPQTTAPKTRPTPPVHSDSTLTDGATSDDTQTTALPVPGSTTDTAPTAPLDQPSTGTGTGSGTETGAEESDGQGIAKPKRATPGSRISGNGTGSTRTPRTSKAAGAGSEAAGPSDPAGPSEKPKPGRTSKPTDGTTPPASTE